MNSERSYTRPWGPKEITRRILTEDETLSNTFKLLHLLLTAQVCSRPRAST